MAIADRMLRAARLESQLYEEVEANPDLTQEAMTVVVLSAVAAGIGGAPRIGLLGLVVMALVALVGWYVWAYATFWIGTRVLPGQQTQADAGQLLRVLGFASAPGILRVVGVIAPLTGLVFLVAHIWMLVAMVVAVRQALDYPSTGRAVAVVLLGAVVYAAVMAFVFSALSIR